jgi:hypothetical protein
MARFLSTVPDTPGSYSPKNLIHSYFPALSSFRALHFCKRRAYLNPKFMVEWENIDLTPTIAWLRMPQIEDGK